MEVTITAAKESDLPNIHTFYKRCGYQAQIGRDDMVFVAQHLNQIVGIGKLCLENNLLVLRGVQVLPESKRKGVGRQLMAFLDKQIRTRECFCLPWENLESFFAGFGFKRIAIEDAPFHLRIRYEKYMGDGLPIVIMARNLQPHHRDT